MRHFLFHPLVFYPLALILAVLVVGLSLRPQSWPRPPEARAGVLADGALVLAGDDLGAPEGDPAQVLYVDRDALGRARALRVAVLPYQAPPSPADPGVRILLTPETTADLSGRPLALEISVRPLPITTAQALAASVQGAGPIEWRVQPLSPQEQVLRYELPATPAARAVGLRVLSENHDYNYGVEIAQIRIVPLGAAAQQNN